MFKKAYNSNPYRVNYNMCFLIEDFRVNDSIVVFKDGEKIRGVVTSTDRISREVTYNSANENGLTARLSDILYLSDGDENWLKQVK